MAIIDVTTDNVEELIAKEGIVIVDFWAPWCGPCRQFGPIFEEAAEQHEDITFAKCDTQEQQEVAGGFGIRSIPTIAVFRDQVMVYFKPGALPKPAFAELIEKVQGLDMEEVRAKIEEEIARQKAKEEAAGEEGEEGSEA